MTIQKQFGTSLKSLREKKQISQEKFALSINMDRTYYASVKAGHRNISLNNTLKIATGFDLKISELFEEVEAEAEKKLKVWRNSKCHHPMIIYLKTNGP